jgi:hypothetical protein
MKPTLPCLRLAALALTAFVTVAQASDLTLDFLTLQERAGDPAPLRWKDADTNAAVFNLAFGPEGAIKGENYLPGTAEVPLGTGISEAKLSFKFVPQSKGVAALTLTSRDGRQRLRIQYDRAGITLAWRDRRVEEQPIVFRKLSALSTGDPKTLEIVMDFIGNQITLSDGEITDLIKANENGAPDIQVAELEKVIVSVEGESILQELKISEK